MTRSKYSLLLAAALLVSAARGDSTPPTWAERFQGWERDTRAEQVAWFRAHLDELRALDAEAQAWEARERHFQAQLPNPCDRARAESWIARERSARSKFVEATRHGLTAELNRRMSFLDVVRSNWLKYPKYAPDEHIRAEDGYRKDYDGKFTSEIAEERGRSAKKISLGVLLVPVTDGGFAAPTNGARYWHAVLRGGPADGTAENREMLADYNSLQNGKAPASFTVDADGNLSWKGSPLQIEFTTPAKSFDEKSADARLVPEVMERWKRYYVRVLGRDRLEPQLRAEPLPRRSGPWNCLENGHTLWRKGASR